MRPTPLQALDPPIRLQPVTGGHTRVLLAQQVLGYLGCPIFGDAEQRGLGLFDKDALAVDKDEFASTKRPAKSPLLVRPLASCLKE